MAETPARVNINFRSPSVDIRDYDPELIEWLKQELRKELEAEERRPHIHNYDGTGELVSCNLYPGCEREI